MPNFYTAADVFTLPSMDEPFGIVYLEAMASGLPIVAPNDRSRRYIVGQAGILCNVKRLGEYSQALERAADLDFAGRSRAQAEKFSWETVANHYRKELTKLLRS